jgi:hypothetical protein
MERRTFPRPLKVALLALLCAAVATPCSWDDTPVLALELRPDAPIDQYIDGNLGIVMPSFARSHLVIAYRYFSGKPLSTIEREGFRDLLRHRLKEYPEDAQPADPGQQWESLRAGIRGLNAGSSPDRWRYLEPYESFENCTDSAFLTAAETLKKRWHELGKSEALQWLDAQELVFANCGSEEVKIPADDPTLPAVLRADRAYQIAAANFYAMKFDDARAQFQRIASDKSSQWNKLSRIAAARSLIRAQSLGVAVRESDPLAVAEGELRAILADASMRSLHDAAWDLLALTTARRNPQQRFAEAAKALLTGETSARRARVQLADYTVLWDKEITGDDELTEWIRAFQSGNLELALTRWQTTKSLPWLITALAYASPDKAAVPALLEASAAHTSNATVAYHRVRLLIAREQYDAARTEADRALNAPELTHSTRNRFLEKRRALARSLDDYLRDAVVKPVAFGEDLADAEASEGQLPPDAAAVMSYWMSLDTLLAAAQSQTLPPHIATTIKDATYTRALLLGRKDIAKKLDPEHPFATNFDIAYHLARHPGLDPYIEPLGPSTSAWWCKGGTPWDRTALQTAALPRFLDVPDTADTESEQLYKLGHGPDWIFRHILARAKSHPTDPRVPEALSLAIKETRHACGDAATAALAKQAFQLLHKRYAKTTWAEETPYWYKP